MRIIVPDTDQLWNEYLDCRYRNLYAPFDLPRHITTSELDHPRDRPGILHRAVILRHDNPDHTASTPTPSPPSPAHTTPTEHRVVAVARLDLQPNHPEGPSAQLRYFAADPAVRGRGVARELLLHLEHAARQHGATRLWMEARTAAANFYQRLGYEDYGLGPNKWDRIPHRLLRKAL